MKALIGLAAAAALLAPPLAGSALADAELLVKACGECHAETDAGLTRISGQRKTPEGWLMTIVRMRLAHGLEISNADQAALVTYLAETQGLAPSETTGLRYALDRDPSAMEAFEAPLADMCGRCHTTARVALQRRTPEEWSLHMDFHVGQYPTTEYQALGRDRKWFEIAKNEMAPMLAEAYPLETDAWTSWQAADKQPVAGDWLVLTVLPGRGEVYGKLTVSGDASPYDISGALRLADGTELPVSGKMNLYTGYEWRANLKIGDETYRQVLAVSEDGNGLEGRQFLRDQDSLGGTLVGARLGSGPAILGTVPSAAPSGEAAVQVVGTGLDGLSFEGAEAKNVHANDFGASAILAADGNALVTAKAGAAEGHVALYDSIDRLAVEPAFTIARVGGGSDVGPAAVPALFQAIGFWNGPDGEPGTADDIRVGPLPAQWTVSPHNEIAELMEDHRFAGVMDAESGIFSPGMAGPNPERPFSTNNAGDLTVTADAVGKQASGQLIVTVQRFIDPPIR